jgi:hypothetical protein
VLHYRIKNLRARDEHIRDRTSDRPLANITDEHLDRLIATAKASTDTDSKREQLEDPNWDQREFGMIPTDQLNRRRTGLAETMRDDDKPEYRWLMAEMDAEAPAAGGPPPPKNSLRKSPAGKGPAPDTTSPSRTPWFRRRNSATRCCPPRGSTRTGTRREPDARGLGAYCLDVLDEP